MLWARLHALQPPRGPAKARLAQLLVRSQSTCQTSAPRRASALLLQLGLKQLAPKHLQVKQVLCYYKRGPKQVAAKVVLLLAFSFALQAAPLQEELAPQQVLLKQVFSSACAAARRSRLVLSWLLPARAFAVSS